MWHSIFHLDLSIFEKILRPLFIYLFLLIAIRLGGHREIGQSNALQLVLILAVANAVQNGIIGLDNSVTGAVIAAITLFLANGVVELAASRSRKFHNLVIGRPIELVAAGKINHRNLKRQRISEQDLLITAIENGATDLRDIDQAFLALNGDVIISLNKNLLLNEQIKGLAQEVSALRALIDSKVMG